MASYLLRYRSKSTGSTFFQNKVVRVIINTVKNYLLLSLHLQEKKREGRAVVEVSSCPRPERVGLGSRGGSSVVQLLCCRCALPAGRLWAALPRLLLVLSLTRGPFPTGRTARRLLTTCLPRTGRSSWREPLSSPSRSPIPTPDCAARRMNKPASTSEMYLIKCKNKPRWML